MNAIVTASMQCLSGQAHTTQWRIVGSCRCSRCGAYPIKVGIGDVPTISLAIEDAPDLVWVDVNPPLDGRLLEVGLEHEHLHRSFWRGFRDNIFSVTIPKP